MGAGGGGSPKMLKHVGGENRNLVTFNINLCSIKKVILIFSVTIAMCFSGSTQDYLKLLFHMFSYSKILKLFKSKI